MFDIGKTIFAARGSYVGLLQYPKHNGGGLWIDTLINSEWGSSGKKKLSTQILKILPCRAEHHIAYEPDYLPHRLRLFDALGEICVHIANSYTVELSLRNMDLALEHDHADLFATNIHCSDRDFSADYPLISTRFSISAENGQLTYSREAKRIYLRGCSSVSITILRTDIAYTAQSLKTEKELEAEFETFYRAFHLEGEMPKLAAYLLWSGTYSPLGLIKKECSPISKCKMGMLFLWANCFIGLSVIPADKQLAMNNFETLMDYQRESGSCPDALNPVLAVDTFTKPPIYGYIYFLYKRSGILLEENAKNIADALSRLAASWTKNRGAMGLCHYIHPWDSGMDNATCFDKTLPLSTPDLNCYMVFVYKAISELYEISGDAEKAKLFSFKKKEYLSRFLQLSWNGKEFCAVSDACEQIPLTNACKFIPLILGDDLPDAVAETVVNDLMHSNFLTRWSIASESTDSLLYDTHRGDTLKPSAYWRGPVWPYYVFLITTGLRDCGMLSYAEDIESRFLNLIEMNPEAIYENYDALTGWGYDDSSDVWSSAIYMMVKMRFRGGKQIEH